MSKIRFILDVISKYKHNRIPGRPAITLAEDILCFHQDKKIPLFQGGFSRAFPIYNVAAGQILERQTEHMNQSRKRPQDKNDVSYHNMKLKP